MSNENITASPSLRFVIREGENQYKFKKPLLDAPERIYDFYKEVVISDENFEQGKENLVLFCLNTKLELIGYSIIHVGTINETSCNPATILRAALVSNAARISILHNHPSGDPSPSRADRTATVKLKEACEVMKIPLVDHIVAGEPAPGRLPYHSFRSEGLI